MRKIKKVFYTGLRNILSNKKTIGVSFSTDKQDPKYTDPLLIQLTQAFYAAKTVKDQEKILQNMIDMKGINPVDLKLDLQLKKK